MQIEKSVEGVLGIWTHNRRIVSADNTTELWRPPTYGYFALYFEPFPASLSLFTVFLLEWKR